MNKNKFLNGVIYAPVSCLLAVTALNSEAGNYPLHYGNSPFNFTIIAEPSAEFPLSDRKTGVLDRYLFSDYRAQQVTVTLPVSRYVGNVSEAVSKGVLSPTAKIIIPAYDIDSNTSPVFDCDGDDIPETFMPEVDDVYFNGEYVGDLTGEDGIWKINDSLEISIDKVNFPSSPGGVATNTISIAIDAANRNAALSGGGVGCKVWAASIDWVGIKFSAASQAYLLPGLLGTRGALESSGYEQKNT